MSDVRQSAEFDAALTEDEHRRWMVLAEHDGWENIEADVIYARAVHAVAWELLEQTMDTADREPSVEVHREAVMTAHRLLGALRVTPPAESR